MKPCPKCGSGDVIITNIMNGVIKKNLVIVGKMGYCTSCKFHGKKVYKRDLREPITEAIWMKRAVDEWNNTPVTSLFTACEEIYGIDYQYSLNSEEVCELIAALATYGSSTQRCRRFDRAEGYKDDIKIVSEMADVIICIYQLLHTRRISFDVLNNLMQEKVERTCHYESVRTAIAKLSKNVNQMTRIANVRSVDAHSANP
jgi:hypothetical protein